MAKRLYMSRAASPINDQPRPPDREPTGLPGSLREVLVDLAIGGTAIDRVLHLHRYLPLRAPLGWPWVWGVARGVAPPAAAGGPSGVGGSVGVAPPAAG